MEHPPGCDSIMEKVDDDELIRRLQKLRRKFRRMKQEDNGIPEKYLPLVLEFTSKNFTNHQNKKVKISIACLIAHVIRISMGASPYQEAKKIKEIFSFLIEQLAGLKNPNDPFFNDYLDLLKTLQSVDSFLICLWLNDHDEILLKLFHQMFKVVEEMSEDNFNIVFNLLWPVIQGCENVSNELLGLLLANIHMADSEKAAYLAKQLVIKTHDNLSYELQYFLLNMIKNKTEEDPEKFNTISLLIWELNEICPEILIHFMDHLKMILSKPKFEENEERFCIVECLCELFTHTEINLAPEYQDLWALFLKEFYDDYTKIRIKFFEYAGHLLLKHPEDEKNIIKSLELQILDVDEDVRETVIRASIFFIRNTEETDMKKYKKLLECIQERTRDIKLKVRKRAFNGLALLYRDYIVGNVEKQLDIDDVPASVVWIKNKIFHLYYMNNNEERLFAEKLISTCLVPNSLSAEERMKAFYHLFGTIDEPARKGFDYIFKIQLVIKLAVRNWLEVVEKINTDETDLTQIIKKISGYFPDAEIFGDYLKEFSRYLEQNDDLLRGVKTIVDPQVSCENSSYAVRQVLKRLKQIRTTSTRFYKEMKIFLHQLRHESLVDVKNAVENWLEVVHETDEDNSKLKKQIKKLLKYFTDQIDLTGTLLQFSEFMGNDETFLESVKIILDNDLDDNERDTAVEDVLKKIEDIIVKLLHKNPFITSIKTFLERICSVLIDDEAIKALMDHVQSCMVNDDSIKSIGLDPSTAVDRGFELLRILAYTNAPYFFHLDILEQLVEKFEAKNENASTAVLKIFFFLKIYDSIPTRVSDFTQQLLSICKNYAQTGTPKQVKHAIRCINAHFKNDASKIFGEILEEIKNELTLESKNCQIAVAAVGHIASCRIENLRRDIKSLLREIIIPKIWLKMGTGGALKDDDDDDDDNWCPKEELPITTACRVESMKCVTRCILGYRRNLDIPVTNILGILCTFIINKGDYFCEKKYKNSELSWLRVEAGCSFLKICGFINHKLTAKQFYSLAELMVDDVKEVRDKIALKFYRRIDPTGSASLPKELFGYFALAGKENDKEKRNLAREHLEKYINHKRKCNEIASIENQHLMVDYMIVYVILVLAQDPEFTDIYNVQQLKMREQYLWFVLEPLLKSNENISYDFYKKLFINVKKYRVSHKPNNDNVNFNLWVLCDLAMKIVYLKVPDIISENFENEVVLDRTYFILLTDVFKHNPTVNYLVPEMQVELKDTARKGLKKLGAHLKPYDPKEKPKVAKRRSKTITITPKKNKTKKRSRASKTVVESSDSEVEAKKNKNNQTV